METKVVQQLTIGDSHVKFNYVGLRRKLQSIMDNPHSLLIYPNYRDYDRNLRYNLASLARWTGSTRTKKRIYSIKDRAWIFARHISFDNTTDCIPTMQRKRIAASYKLARNDRSIAPFYTLSYHIEYGRSSFWTVSHLQDMMNNDYFSHSVSMYVMIDSDLRKPQSVIKPIKEICDENWRTQYPQTMKSKYKSLKQILLTDMDILNRLNKNNKYSTKHLLLSYRIQLRFEDEDTNRHLNTNIYVSYIIEALNNLNKDIRNNKKVICCMSNIYWKELRMIKYEFCYVNIWDITYKQMNGELIQIYVGTVDIDKNVCNRNEDGTQRNNVNNNNNPEWIHMNGFVAGLVSVNRSKNKL